MRFLLPLQAMRRLIVQIWLFAALLCGLSNSPLWVRAQGVVSRGHQQEECVQRYDGLTGSLMEERQQPLGESLVKSQQSHRVNSSRPARLLPTHGGKSGRGLGQSVQNNFSDQIKYFYLCRCLNIFKARMGVTSPRFYYVIALRRILC